VIEVAADMDVDEIIASRRQVDIGGGYTGLEQRDLVELVRSKSKHTKVVRDHGGPHQSGIEDDDDVRSLMRDVEAGFDGIHIDVCKLPHGAQFVTLFNRVTIFRSAPTWLEIGGEHDSQDWNLALVGAALKASRGNVKVGIVETGGHIWEDRQIGQLLTPMEVLTNVRCLRILGLEAKAHNQDWNLRRYALEDVIDSCNIAPEYAKVETEAIIQVLHDERGDELLNLAYDSGMWRRWFNDDEHLEHDEATGWWARAVCAVRYAASENERMQELLKLDLEQEHHVRKAIHDAIARR
jgi:hypothetical protein